MNLNHVIITSILKYPSLYKYPTYEMSRLAVLDHIFLVNGNGLEWCQKEFQFLAEIDHRTGKLITDSKGLKKRFPAGYFEKQLWYLEVEKDSVKEIKQLLKGKYFFIENDQYGHGPTIYFEAEKDEAASISLKYGTFFRKFNYALKDVRPFDAQQEGEVCPYPICEYATLYEMMEGHTSKLSQEDFELNLVDPQWIAGGLEIAKYTLGMYKNPEKHCLLPYCPNESRCFGNATKDWEKSWNKAVADGVLDKWKKERDFPQSISGPLEAAIFSWEKFKNEQISILERFIAKYEGK